MPFASVKVDLTNVFDKGEKLGISKDAINQVIGKIADNPWKGETINKALMRIEINSNSEYELVYVLKLEVKDFLYEVSIIDLLKKGEEFKPLNEEIVAQIEDCEDANRRYIDDLGRKMDQNLSTLELVVKYILTNLP